MHPPEQSDQRLVIHTVLELKQDDVQQPVRCEDQRLLRKRMKQRWKV
jgi:hypothetical protein